MSTQSIWKDLMLYLLHVHVLHMKGISYNLDSLEQALYCTTTPVVVESVLNA